MIVRVHKIYWPGKYTRSGEDVNFEVTDCDAFVTRVTHPCAKWAINEAWVRVSSWFQGKGATITLGEPKEVTDIKI